MSSTDHQGRPRAEDVLREGETRRIEIAPPLCPGDHSLDPATRIGQEAQRQPGSESRIDAGIRRTNACLFTQKNGIS